jgi:hypothetical protein
MSDPGKTFRTVYLNSSDFNKQERSAVLHNYINSGTKKEKMFKCDGNRLLLLLEDNKTCSEKKGGAQYVYSLFPGNLSYWSAAI